MEKDRDYNPALEGEEANIEWTAEDQAILIAQLKADLLAILKDDIHKISFEGIASRQTRRLVMRVMELRKDLIALIERSLAAGGREQRGATATEGQ